MAKSGTIGHPSYRDTTGDPEVRSLCSNERRDCILLQLGSLFCALESIGLWPEKPPNNVHVSPSHLHRFLKGGLISDCHRHHIGKPRTNNWGWQTVGGESFPSTCGSFGNILRQMKDMGSEETNITEAQAKYMKAQRSKVSRSTL